MRERVNICQSTINESFSDGWHNSLHYYIQIRSLYKGSIIYKFSNRKVAALIGCAPSVVSKHINILIENGLCHLHSGNLCFYSLNKVKENKSNKIILNLPVFRNKRRMLDELRGTMIIQNLDSQILRIYKSSEIVKKCKIANSKISKKELQFISKNGGVDKTEKNINRRITLSNKSIGRLFSRSQSTGKIYQKRLNESSLIRSRAKIVIVDEVYNHNMAHFMPSCFFRTSNNQLALQLSNTIWSPYMKSYTDLLKGSCIEFHNPKVLTQINNFKSIPEENDLRCPW